MFEKKTLITNKNIGLLIAIVFLLGVFVRTYQLGVNPLDDHEAAFALQALDRDGVEANSRVETAPLLVLGTTLLFHFFEPGNGFVRLLPALMGSLIVLFPLFFKKYLSPRSTLILSIGLAVEPGLVAMSRVADSHIISLGLFGFLMFAMLESKKIWMGIWAGLLLLSGPNLGFLLLGILFLLLWDFVSDKFLLNQIKKHFGGFEWRTTVISGVTTFVVGGTLFLFRADSISAAFMGIAKFFLGWIEPINGLKIAHIGIVLLAYELFVLVFGVWGLIAVEKSKENFLKYLLRWIVVALLILILNPSRNAGDLIWVIVPLWIFASLNLNRLVASVKEIDQIHVGGFIFLLVMFGFVVLNWVSVFNYEFDQQQILLRWVLIAGSIILILLVTFMLNYGWASKHGSVSVIAALTAGLFFFSFLPAMWNSANLGSDPGLEFWRFAPYPSQLPDLKETIDDLSEWNHGGEGGLEIVSTGVDSASMQWLLRDYDVEYVSALSPGSSPEVILTPVNETGVWSASYTGQDFVIRDYANWSLLLPREWQQWLVHRNIQTSEELIILWVRTDMFPGELITEEFYN